MKADTLPELLRESAPLARRDAPRLCWRHAESGATCAWNHGLWQYLRLFDLVANPMHQEAFFREALASLAAGPRAPRVLVSAAADYTMLALAHGALGARAGITVVDRCETPLMLNRWYAERAGASIATSQSDILEFRDAQAYDAICTHAFLILFSPEQRRALLARWHNLLRPGGKVVTVARLPQAGDAAVTGFSPEQAQAFVAEVRACAEPMGLDLAPEATEFTVRAGRSAIHPTREGLVQLFEEAGFRIERLDVAPVAGARRALRGPTLPGTAEYASIVAVRP